MKQYWKTENLGISRCENVCVKDFQISAIREHLQIRLHEDIMNLLWKSNYGQKWPFLNDDYKSDFYMIWIQSAFNDF